MFGAESRRLHRALATALAGAIGLVVFAIVLLDHPSAGATRVLPEGYQRLIEHQAETLVSKERATNRRGHAAGPVGAA